jgi:hypothetical protein
MTFDFEDSRHQLMLERARRREAERRPVTAEITVKDGGAVLRLLDRGGNVAEDRHRITLPGSVDYLCGAVLTLAGEFINAAGFRLDGGWDEATFEQGVTRSPIDVTREYLAYIDRKLGPVPPLGPRPEGLSAQRRGYGAWQLCYLNRQFWELDYTARLSGPEWRLSNRAGEKVLGEYADAAAAMRAAVERGQRSGAGPVADPAAFHEEGTA